MELTAKQEKFCQCVAEGNSNAEAYRVAYDAIGSNLKTVYVNACKVAAKAKVKERIKELKKELTLTYVWSRGQSVMVLSKIALSPTSTDANKIAAVKELNLMHGFSGGPDDGDVDVQPIKVTIEVKSARSEGKCK